MAKLTKRSAVRSAPDARSEQQQGRKLVKKATNLTLDPDAVARGEQYGARYGRKLSQLVNGFLAALPVVESDSDVTDLSPAVRRLYGVAAGSTTDRETYHAHLAEKYGTRDA